MVEWSYGALQKPVNNSSNLFAGSTFKNRLIVSIGKKSVSKTDFLRSSRSEPAFDYILYSMIPSRIMVITLDFGSKDVGSIPASEIF